ncbi:hypothetical protein COV18_00670 [Candidatus Woesearchaeota archaeon CG10_big_fil_rev_8_21_14_0_10_37_12]|nr:MAG: hypothetical protein COV18_00670 [Candidatus Woesearchaeota archaeon CG10_big_fil_rev_8_21_14_0_10_37_12]
MFEKFTNRENKIFEVLNFFVEQKLNFVVIGGYAVSAYKHRFSIDADLVIRKEDKETFAKLLEKMNFKKTIMKYLDHVYAPEFIRYETKEELSISIDLLINGVGSRTTNASFNLEELKKHSKQRKILGTEKETTVLVPDRSILVILKLHSGRLTDFRDIVAICKNLDHQLIKKIIWRGKKEIVRENIKKLLQLIEEPNFINSFKGVFAEKKYDADIQEVKKLKKLLD